MEAAKCAVCADSVGETVHRCERCQVAYHCDCWEYAGGCAIFGCDPHRVPLPAIRTSPSFFPAEPRAGSWAIRSALIMGFPVASVAIMEMRPGLYLGFLMLCLLAYVGLSLFAGESGEHPEEAPTPEPLVKSRMVFSVLVFLNAPQLWILLIFGQLALGGLTWLVTSPESEPKALSGMGCGG